MRSDSGDGHAICAALSMAKQPPDIHRKLKARIRTEKEMGVWARRSEAALKAGKIQEARTALGKAEARRRKLEDDERRYQSPWNVQPPTENSAQIMAKSGTKDAKAARRPRGRPSGSMH